MITLDLFYKAYLSRVLGHLAGLGLSLQEDVKILPSSFIPLGDAWLGCSFSFSGVVFMVMSPAAFLEWNSPVWPDLSIQTSLLPWLGEPAFHLEPTKAAVALFLFAFFFLKKITLCKTFFSKVSETRGPLDMIEVQIPNYWPWCRGWWEL